MTEQSAPVPMLLADAADAYFVARSPRKDSAHTTAAYRRDLRLLAGIIAAHLGVEVAELGVDALTVPVLRTAFAAFFRFNRRRTPMAAFQTLLGLGSQQSLTTYAEVIASGPRVARRAAERIG